MEEFFRVLGMPEVKRSSLRVSVMMLEGPWCRVLILVLECYGVCVWNLQMVFTVFWVCVWTDDVLQTAGWWVEDVEVEVSSDWHSRIIQSFSCLVYCKVLFFYIFHYTLVYKLILFIFLICGKTEKFESIFSAKKKHKVMVKDAFGHFSGRITEKIGRQLFSFINKYAHDDEY